MCRVERQKGRNDWRWIHGAGPWRAAGEDGVGGLSFQWVGGEKVAEVTVGSRLASDP